MDNSCTVLKERIARRIVFGWLALAKQIFPVGQILFCRIFLQDNQVAAHFRTCIFGKQIVGQSYNRNQIIILHQRPAYGFVLRAIQNALRSDVSQQTTLTEHISTFQKKVIVYASGSLYFGIVPASGKG